MFVEDKREISPCLLFMSLLFVFDNPGGHWVIWGGWIRYPHSDHPLALDHSTQHLLARLALESALRDRLLPRD